MSELASTHEPPRPHVIVREQSHGRIRVSHAFLAASSQTNTLLAVSPLVFVISLQWPPTFKLFPLTFSLPFPNLPSSRVYAIGDTFPLCDAES